MVFQKYSPELKYSAVKSCLLGKSLEEINLHLAAEISHDSIDRWTDLYNRTQLVVCDLTMYLPQGQPFELNNEDLAFITEMVTDQPTFYANEIQRALIEQNGVRVSMSTILNTLHKRLNMSKKTIRKVNPRQDEEWCAFLHLSGFCFTFGLLGLHW